jgi:hypothetical protein
MDPKYDQDPNQEENQVQVEHFLPVQVVLHLQHPADTSRAELAEILEAFLREQSDERSWRGQLEPPSQEKFITFPAGTENDTAISIVPTWMQNREAGKGELIDLLLEIHEDLVEPKEYSTEPMEGSQKRLHPIPITPDNAITLNSVSPNWLIGSGSHQAGTVAPGSWPKRAWRAKKSPIFQFPDINEFKSEVAQMGAGVTVAILDTAPCQHDLIDAYNTWHNHEDDTDDHELIGSLLKPGGPLSIYRMTEEEILETMDFSALGHRYRMADHGLFVAGIIHTIAPQASLHLYEALNLYGIGSLETIARGLLQVLGLLAGLRNSDNRQPLIVNCSLALGVSEDDPDLPEQLRDPDLFEDMTVSFEQIIALLDQDDVVVVAAAGNDAHEKEGEPGTRQRPPARFPAAFKQVIGVGALPKEHPAPGQKHKAASYSNLADRPETIGYATLGGEPGVEKGVLGVYIGDFPKVKAGINKPEKAKNMLPEDIDYTRNDTGWAWWAGTSFATPIISGLLAAWWGQNLNKLGDDARGFLETATQGKETGKKEKVVVVDQVIP